MADGGRSQALSRPRVILGSGSPRRRELLTNLGLDFVVAPADIDETEHPGEAPIPYVHRLAIEKAMAVDAADDDIVIAADTTVDVDGAIFAKPVDDDDARRMLGVLSGRDHLVHTGVAVRHGGRVESDVVTTVVTMSRLSTELLEWYVGTGEPHGKAGAYAMQGGAAVLVSGVHGSVSNVIGLPMTMLATLLERAGVPLPSLLA